MWIGVQAVQVALKGVYMCGPESAERRQPGFNFLKRFRSQSVQAALSVYRTFDETRLTQDP